MSIKKVIILDSCILIFPCGYNASTLFLNLQKKSLTCSERGTLKTCYPLWSTVSLDIIWIGHPYSSHGDDTKNLCEFESWEPSPVQSKDAETIPGIRSYTEEFKKSRFSQENWI